MYMSRVYHYFALMMPLKMNNVLVRWINKSVYYKVGNLDLYIFGKISYSNEVTTVVLEHIMNMMYFPFMCAGIFVWENGYEGYARINVKNIDLQRKGNYILLKFIFIMLYLKLIHILVENFF